MRIITTRKLRFYSKDRKQSFVSAGNNIIETCPDWAVDDDMFKAGRASGVVQIISSRSEQKELENNPEKHLSQNAHDEKESESTEEINEAEEESVEEVEEDDIETPAERKARKRAERKARKRAEESEEE